MLVFGEADAKMGAMHTDFTRGDTCREMKADRELERAGRVPGTETGRPRAQGCWKGWKEGAWGGTGETLSLLLRSSSRPGLPSREEDTHGPGAKPGLGRGLLLRSLGRSSGARGNPGRAITGFPPHTSRRESVSTVAGKLGVGGSVPENSPAEAAPTSFPASRRTTWSSFHQKPKHTYPLVPWGRSHAPSRAPEPVQGSLCAEAGRGAHGHRRGRGAPSVGGRWSRRLGKVFRRRGSSPITS